MNKMHHITPIVRPMPMLRTGRAPDRIARSKSFRRAASIANPSVARNDPDQLTAFVGMPICASTRREHHSRDGVGFVIVQRCEVDVSAKPVVGPFVGFDVGGCWVVAEDCCCRHFCFEGFVWIGVDLD